MLIIFNNKAEQKLLNLKPMAAQHTIGASPANPANPALLETCREEWAILKGIMLTFHCKLVDDVQDRDDEDGEEIERSVCVSAFKMLVLW